jgi:hypothetical protein
MTASTSFRDGDKNEDLDYLEIEREENELRELLNKEKEAHLRTKVLWIGYLIYFQQEKYKDLLGGELIKQHNLKMEKQEVVAQVFRLEGNLKEMTQKEETSLNDRKLLHNLLQSTKEQLLMTRAELDSYKWNINSPTLDKSTDTDGLTPAPVVSLITTPTSRRVSKASVHIPSPTLTSNLDEIPDSDDQSDGEDIPPESNRNATTKSKRKISIPSNNSKTPSPPVVNRRFSKLRDNLQQNDKTKKVKESRPSRRQTEYVPKSKIFTPKNAEPELRKLPNKEVPVEPSSFLDPPKDKDILLEPNDPIEQLIQQPTISTPTPLDNVPEVNLKAPSAMMNDLPTHNEEDNLMEVSSLL